MKNDKYNFKTFFAERFIKIQKREILKQKLKKNTILLK